MSFEQTQAVLEALRVKFGDDAFATFEEVHQGVGGRGRRLDFMALSLWPSRGLGLEGFEIKSDRRDWLRELKNPQKGEGFFQFCNRFWLATSSVKVAKPEEVPETWGLMTMRGSVLRIVKEAPAIEGKELTREFVAELLRRHAKARDHRIRIGVAAARKEERDRLADDGATVLARNLKRAREELAEIAKAVAEFEKASGLRIAEWSAGSVGKSVAFLQRMGEDAENPEERIDEVLRYLAKTTESLELSKQLAMKARKGLGRK
jgi:hypothetical protein